MALIQQSAETINSGSSTTDTVTFPSATTAGNLVLLLCFGPSDTGAIAFSCTGFTADAYRGGNNVGSVALLRKIETSGTTTYTVTHTGVLPYRVIGLEFNNVDNATPLIVADGRDGTSGGGTVMYAAPVGAIDTTSAGPIIAMYAMDRVVTTSGPSGWAGGAGALFTPDGTSRCLFNYTITTGAVTDERGAVTTSTDLWQACVIVAYKAMGAAAPVITGPSATSPGTTTVTASVTTDTASGTLYQLARIGGSAATDTAIIATGQSMAVSSTTPSRSYTGLTAGTTGYVIDMVQVVSAVNSNVVSTAAFNTSAAAATAVTLTGPSGGVNGAASTNFTVGANGAITGTVTVTPSSGGGGGTFTPSSVNISSGTPTATFTYTPASTGSKSISVTNSGGLTNPSAITYTVTGAAATQIVLPLSGAPNLTGLDYAVWSQTQTRNLTTPIVKGNTAVISGASCTLSITGLGILQGATCWVEINNSDGTTTQATMFGYSGPATAS